MAASIGDLTWKLVRFRDARDWQQFHTPRNLLLALLGEIGEVASIVQWKSDGDLAQLLKDESAHRDNVTLQKRLGMHQRAGLEPIALFQFGSGEEAYSIEQTVVAWWRDEHESGPVPKELLPDGWTETVFSDQVPLSLTLSYLTGHLSLDQLVTDRTTD